MSDTNWMASESDRKRIAAELFGTTPSALGFYFRLYDGLIVPEMSTRCRLTNPSLGNGSQPDPSLTMTFSRLPPCSDTILR